MRIGIFTDYPDQTVLSGPAIHTRFLKENLRKRGHEVTLFGPSNESDRYEGSADQHLFKGVPYPSHPNTKIVMPWPMNHVLNPPRVDIIHGQINSEMMRYGNWMRKMWRIPVLNTHIIHLPTHSHFLVGDKLYKNGWIREQLAKQADTAERSMATIVNDGDGMIVQSRFMVDYWRDRGVTVPIDVVGRPIDPQVFDAKVGSDPFPANFKKGARLIVVSRHDREKRLDELIQIFAEHIAPANPDATLTLVGDGAEHQNLRKQAQATRYADRIYMPGAIGHNDLVHWYGHASIFVYTSISETFGNVVNEALWCGLPCVAYDDQMGVAHQVTHLQNGIMVQPDQPNSHAEFTQGVLDLLSNKELYKELSANAAHRARATSHPDVIIDTFENIYDRALVHVHQKIQTPLSEQSRARQIAELGMATSEWALTHGLLLGVAGFATKTGLGRGPVEEAPQNNRKSDFIEDIREAAE